MMESNDEHKANHNSDSTKSPNLEAQRRTDAGTSLTIEAGVVDWSFIDPVIRDERSKNDVSWQDE